MLSKCFLILIFHFDLLSIQSWSQRFIPTTSACGDKYLCWLLAAFGNLFMASFYCTPKEIGSLCILGKKTPLSNHPYFCGLQSTPCGHLSAWEQRGFLWSWRAHPQQPTCCLCGEFLLLAQTHRPPCEGCSTHTLSFAWIMICLGDLHRAGREGKERKERERRRRISSTFMIAKLILCEGRFFSLIFLLVPRNIFNKGKQTMCLPASDFFNRSWLQTPPFITLHIISYTQNLT